MKIISWAELVERVPAFRHIGKPPLRLATVLQNYPTDCAAACLCMISTWLGQDLCLTDIQKQGALSRLGWTAKDFSVVAAKFGLKARTLRVESLADLAQLDRPVVLHWRFNHFVVLKSMHAAGAWIIDPASGETWVPTQELSECFTGVVIFLERNGALCKTSIPSAKGNSAWQLVLSLFANVEQLPQLILASCALQMLALAPALFVSVAFGQALHGNSQIIRILIIAMVLISALHLLSTLIKNQLAALIRSRTTVLLGGEVIDRLLGAKYSNFQSRAQSDWLARLGATDTVREGICTIGLTLLLDALLVFGSLVTLFLIMPVAAIFVSIMFVILAAGLSFAGRKRHALMRKSFQAQGAVDGFQVQMVSGIETLHSGNMIPWAHDCWSQLIVRRVNAEAELFRFETNLQAATQLLTFAGPMLLATLVIMKTTTSAALGPALIAYTVGLRLFSSLISLSDAATQLHRILFQAERIVEMLELPQIRSDSNNTQLHALHHPVCLQLKALSFSHNPNAPRALDGVDFKINKAEFVLLVGASGCGKSSLLGVLAGLYEPQTGQALFDKHARSEIDHAGSSRPIIAVPQFPYLFSGTIRDNICMGRPDANLDDILAAAKSAAIHDEIEAMPMRYDSLIFESGVGLSGGQRQRIAIARAILMNPGVLLLDESTSALDSINERRVLENLSQLSCTRILATHRMDLAHLADRVIVMHEGKIVESGTAATLGITGHYFKKLNRTAMPNASINRLNEQAQCEY